MYSAGNKLWASFFLIMLMVPYIFALKCYECDNCEEEQDYKECDSSSNTCMKFIIGNIIMKRCSRKELCSAREVEKTLNEAWTGLKNLFSKDQETAKQPSHVHCCDSNYCNSSNLPQAIFGLNGAMIFALVMYYMST